MDLADVVDEFAIRPVLPAPRPFDLDPQIEFDTPRTRRHDEYTVRKEYRLFDTMGNEKDRIVD